MDERTCPQVFGVAGHFSQVAFEQGERFQFLACSCRWPGPTPGFGVPTVANGVIDASPRRIGSAFVFSPPLM